ncbi:hypothetical protein MZM54_00735 [[Brevibacterium] frigoritolerans]|nr:hypothetical protein [Peribacillus frigoritolerans]
MSVRKKHSDNVLLLEPKEQSEQEIFHELIGAIRLNGKVQIGSFERRYSNYGEASKAMDALINQGIFHVGTIRTHYLDGTVRLLGAWLDGADNGVGLQVAGDMLEHIVGDTTVGLFKTEKLFRRDIAKAIARGIIPE